MIQIVSIILFAFGVVVFFFVIRKQKKEEEYYDRFYFIVSKHNTITEYLSFSNRAKYIFNHLKEKIYKFNEKYLSQTQFH